jgi:hypothetical protein
VTCARAARVMKKWRGELGSEGAALVAANGCVNYSADTGLVVAVDGIDNLPASVAFSGIYVLSALCPPADFYKSDGQVRCKARAFDADPRGTRHVRHSCGGARARAHAARPWSRAGLDLIRILACCGDKGCASAARVPHMPCEVSEH